MYIEVMDDDFDDDSKDLSADDILEEERIAKDPNQDVMRHQPKLPQDFASPAASQDDPLTRDLPDDHPSLDDGIDPDEKYHYGGTDASDYWDETDGNDRKDDALYGDNGPNL
jgi:hypothetical protein